MKRPLACAAMMTVGLFSCSKKKMHDTPIPPPSVSPMPTIAASLVDPATVFCRALKVKGVVTTEGSARTRRFLDSFQLK